MESPASRRAAGSPTHGRHSLRTKILAYVITLHLILAAAAVSILIERPALLFLVELLFVLSVSVSVRLVRALFVPLDLIQTGAELIAERDFTSRLVPVDQPEMDTLIDVYNRMIDRLREERLTAEEQFQLLQKIVEASPSGIVLCDFDGKVERMNPAAERILRCHPERSEGPGRVGLHDRNSCEMPTQAPPDGDRFVGSLPSTPPAQVPRSARDDIWADFAEIPSGESRLITHLGARRLKVSRAEFRDRGFVKSFYVVEEMTEELRLSEKAAYEKLIRMMSHEVNNSVGAVRSLLESSLQYAPQVSERDRDDFRSAMTIASGRIDALNRFMSAFADVVRIPPPRRAPARIAEIVGRVAALLRPELEARAIRLDLDLGDGAIVEVDESQIEQVVLNIFRNAIDAVGREGSIDVSFRAGDLAIADSGPGIPDAVRHELFTPFFTTKREGRGLGLTIVHDILANHGLPFSLMNRQEGGAEFRISF